MTQEQIAEQLQQAESEINKGNYAEAERLLSEVLSEPMTNVQVAEVNRMLGTVAWQQGNYPKALRDFNHSLGIAETLNHQVIIAKVVSGMGNVYLNLSDYPRALEYYGKGLRINEELANKEGIARDLGNIGNIYVYISDYTKALKHYNKALTTNEEIGNKDGIARNLGNIGTIYGNLSDYTRALEYIGKGIATYKELGNKIGIAANFCYLGNVYNDLSDYAKALDNYNKALLINKKIGAKSGIAVNLGNIGNVYSKLSKHVKALTYINNALLIYKELGKNSGIALMTNYIGAIYANKNFNGYNATKAEEYLLKALSMHQEIGAKQHICESHQSISNLYENQERWQEALMHFKKYHELKDQLLNEEAKKKAQQFDFERKQAEHEKQLAVERAKVAEKENILNNILPEEITARLINGENPIADKIDIASVLFMDIVEFTQLSSRVSADQLVYLLNQIFTNCDSVMEEFGLEKIKTIGDSYMAVCGAPVPRKDHAERSAKAALKLVEVMKNLEIKLPDELGSTEWIKDIGEIGVRVGLHCGSMVAGVIGEKKFLYDLWGDSVNTASRMESHGKAGKIHISEEFKQAVETQCVVPLQFISCGELEIKGKGKMKTYFLEKA